MSDLIAGRYKLDSQIKPGGTVYKAVDQQLRRTVAIKVWPEGRDDIQAARRFYREAVRCARLAHPSIVPVYDAGEHVEISNRTAVPVAPYMVMELVGGRTLASALEGRQPLALSDDRDWVRGALDLFIQVCRGLHYGHERGLVHGAVTPENIIIRSDGEGIKILNYGITPLTEVEPIPYMSPEQLEPGRDLDRRSDLFSLGVVMSEVLLGIHPFCDENPEDTRARIRAGHRSPVEELVPQWASEMGDVIIRLLALNPEERFASCEQLEATLEGLKHQLFNGIRLHSNDISPVPAPAEPLLAETSTAAGAEAVLPPVATIGPFPLVDTPDDVASSVEEPAREFPMPFAVGVQEEAEEAVDNEEELHERVRPGFSRLLVVVLAVVVLAGVIWFLLVGRNSSLVTSVSSVSQQAKSAAPGVEESESGPPGTLSLDVLPWAKVDSIVNLKTGREVSIGQLEAPCTISLPAGRYAVSVSHPEFGSSLLRVEITGGQVSLIHHSLLSQEKLDELLGTSGSPESR